MRKTLPAPVDVLDHLLDIRPGSRLDVLRDDRPDVRCAEQESFDALLGHGGHGLSLAEREAVALAVAVRHGTPALVVFHRQRLSQAGATAALVDNIMAGAPAATPRMAAILHHVALLTERPRDATQADLETLRACGLTPQGIVTLSQLVSFMAYQIRIAMGLSLLEAAR